MAGASQSDEDKAHARILKTTDEGATWRAVFDSSRPGDNTWKLAFQSAKVSYATIMSYAAPPGEARGYVVKTEDGGEHWRPLVVTRDHDWIPYGINFVSDTHGWVGGATGGYETTDGGAHWHRVSMGLSTNKMRILPKPDGGHTILRSVTTSTGAICQRSRKFSRGEPPVLVVTVLPFNDADGMRQPRSA